MTIPKSVKMFFWDIDIKSVGKENRDFVIIRIAEKGGLKEARWLLKTFGIRTIRRVVGKSKNVSAKSKNFWTTI